MNKKTQLTIYTASAGAGKTYTLTRDFISFALSRGGDYFRHILAITFTKKATKEMKTRIVNELQKLASGKSPSSYYEELSKLTLLDKETIQKRSQFVLTNLLVDYTAFRIRTIDSFFEEIVRTFASEIGYSTRYKIELDADTRLHRATLLLLSSLNSPSFSESFDRIKGIVEENILEGKRYNITSVVEMLGKKLFAESSIDEEEEGRLPETEQINTTRKSIEIYLKEVEEALKKRGSSKEKIYAESLSFLDEQLSLLGTFSDLKATLREMGRSTNSMLLHSSQTFIREIIKGNDAPFIYERVGTQLHHYLIDEFQDTSRLQFQNLCPLIDNSLSLGYSNLVVGDVKQSIYKFRHCDRTILSSSLVKEFPQYARTENLEYNWRSAKEIITFNNKLYTTLPLLVKEHLEKIIEEALKKHTKAGTLDVRAEERLIQMPTEITDNYKTIEQKTPPSSNKTGGVEIIYSQKGERIDKSLAKTIITLVEERGYSPGDIAILCAKNSEVAAVATALLQATKAYPEKAHYFRFMGAEALHIINSDFIGFIIELFRALNSSELSSCYEVARFRYEQLLAHSISNTEIAPFEKIFEQLKAHFYALNLYELTEFTIELSKGLVSEEELPYIMLFLDLVSTFSNEETADLYSFLYWWDEKGSKTDLPAENIDDAIHLMTIHKSKGLEFPIVLLPYPYWDLGLGVSKKTDLLRVRIPALFANEMNCPIEAAYVRLVSKLADTIFIEDYYREVVSNIIDRLNLFYVATTRAEIGLLLWLPQSIEETTKPTKTRFPLDYFVLNALEQLRDRGDYLLTSIPRKKGGEISNQKEEHSIKLPSLETLFSSSSPTIKIRFSGEKHFQENEKQSFGSILHDVMSYIKTKNDIEPYLEKAVKEGKVAYDKAQKVLQILFKALENPIIASWFSPQAKVYTEQTIISPNTIHYLRPDRIVLLPNGIATVIDYKFGQKKREHIPQVVSYCRLVEKIGFGVVEGYLLYLCEDAYHLEKVYSSSEL